MTATTINLTHAAYGRRYRIDVNPAGSRWCYVRKWDGGRLVEDRYATPKSARNVFERLVKIGYKVI